MGRTGRSPREQRDRRTRRNLWFAVAAVTVFLGLVGSLVWVARDVNPPLTKDLCPVGENPSDEVVIVFDATDPWNEVQRTVIKQAFQDIQSSVPRFGRVSLYRVGSDTGDVMPEPAVRLCNPGSLDQLGNVKTTLFANADSIRARWEGSFIGKLDSLIPDSKEENPRSYVMETLRAAAIHAFGRRSKQGLEKQLYVFSDLLQNSPAYSHYEDPVWDETDAERLSDVGMLGTQALRNVHVELFLLDRQFIGSTPGHLRSRLVKFWDIYFSEQGAQVHAIRRIEG